jgi:hypothetical protein
VSSNDHTRFDPRAFFEVLLPAIFAERQAKLGQVDGVLQFYLMGEKDHAWFANLGDGSSAIFEGEAEAADLVLAIDEALVLPLITGELDVESALESESLQVAGEQELLEGLAEALSESITGMGILYASVRGGQ